MLGTQKIDQVDSFTYLGNIISKDFGSSEDIKSRIAKAQGVFSQLKKVCCTKVGCKKDAVLSRFLGL